MIRISYKDFSAGTHDMAGLHGRAEGGPPRVTVYLLPGLTTAERRAVLRRLRMEASRGFGPPLPLPQLALALGLARMGTAARTVMAIVRLHPAVTLLPSVCAVTVLALFVTAAGARPGVTPSVRGDVVNASAVSMTSRSGAWYACFLPSHALVPRPGVSQLACRPAAGGVPQTAHRPGPLDFAW